MRSLTTQAVNQLFSDVSDDPFLMLFELSHPDWPNIVRLVNNTEDIVHQGNTYQAFPVKVILPPDDNESERIVSIQFDNTGLDLIELFRSIFTPIKANIKMILASNPNVVQMEIGEMLVRDITYNSQNINCKLVMDDFLNTEVYNERYTPVNFRGIF